MIDTIEALEAIGKDASLRHAPSDQLIKDPALTGVSESLRAAILKSDPWELSAELGLRAMQSIQVTQAPGREEEEEEEEDPDRDEEDAPSLRRNLAPATK